MPTALGKQAYGICGKQGESVVMADINGQMYVNTLMYECTYMYECINNMYWIYRDNERYIQYLMLGI